MNGNILNGYKENEVGVMKAQGGICSLLRREVMRTWMSSHWVDRETEEQIAIFWHGLDIKFQLPARKRCQSGRLQCRTENQVVKRQI